ncbi:MAG: ATP-dependent DNA helicase RecQ, partial [Limisphaerales bacterium]
AVLDYVKQDKQCRALVITDYFGEKVNQPCGNCDVCKKRNLNNSTQDLEAHTIAKIKKIISKAPLSVEELALQITTLDSVGVGRLIEQMLDQDILSVNAAGKLLYNAAY